MAAHSCMCRGSCEVHMRYERKPFVRLKARVMCLTSIFSLMLALAPGITTGQEKKVINLENEPIPRNYQSWSLFLICNPQWLLAENDVRLANLYAQFNAFGDAIGAKHLAVWLAKRPPAPGRPIAQDIDVNQNAAFCTKMKLLPSKSPYVVVTTSYLDVKAANLTYQVAIELNNLPPADIGNLLNKLADQLIVQGLRQADFDSEQYWNAWLRSVESIADLLSGMIRTVKISINSGPVKFEIEGGLVK